MRIDTRRSGFTLVELLVVSVIASLMLAAAYQALFIQEKSYRTGGAIIRGQDAVRTAVGVLEAELREIGTIGGAAIGGTDVMDASPDSITFRAQRKIGFLCESSKSEKWAVAVSHSNPFAANDRLLIFVENSETSRLDDAWGTATVSNATSTTSATCTAVWPGRPLQKIQLTGHDLTGVVFGAPVRSFEIVTYGLYDFGHLGWGLGRRLQSEALPRMLIGGLAPPEDGGLVFQYLDGAGAPTTDPTAIASMRIQVRTVGQESANVPQVTLASTLHLRNN